MLRKVIEGSVLTGFGIFLLSIFEYLYVIYAGNVLPAPEFGRLNTAIAILTILVALATAGLGTSIAKFVAEREEIGWRTACLSSGLALQIGIAVAMALVLLAVTPVIRLSRLADMGDLLLVLVASFPVLTLAAVLPFGFLGLDRIFSYNLAMVINAGTRALAAFPLALIYAGARELFLAFLIGGAATTAYCLVGMKSLIRRTEVQRGWVRKLFVYSLPVATSSLLVILFVRADVVVLKFLLSGDANLVVAQYSAPAVLARGVFYLSSAVAVSLLPAVSRAGNVPVASIGRLMASLAAVQLIVIALAARFDTAIVSLLYPPELVPLSYLMPYIVLAMAIVSLAHLVGTALIAVGRPGESARAFVAGFAVFTAASLVLIPERIDWLGSGVSAMAMGVEGVVAALVAGGLVALALSTGSLIRLRSDRIDSKRAMLQAIQ